MKILVTGGAGFIGSNLCDELLRQGHTVICVDNFNEFYSPKIKERNVQEALSHPNYELYRIDITDYDRMRSLISQNRPDKIIHLAATAGVRNSLINPRIYEEVNIRGTLNMLELAREFGVSNLVYASSSSVYGNNTKIPFSETDNVDRPISPYAATKKAGELLCHTHHHIYKMNITCLRFFTVYGPRGRPDMAPYMFTKSILNGEPIHMFGDGETMRDYTYITDIIKGIINSLDLEGYHIINLGNNNPVKLKEFIEIIEKHAGKKAVIVKKPIPQGDVNVTYADISKAKEMLNYDPEVTIEEGLKRLVEWYKTHNGNGHPKKE